MIGAIALLLGVPALFAYNYFRRQEAFVSEGEGGVSLPGCSYTTWDWRFPDGPPQYLTFGGGSREPTFFETIPIIGQHGAFGFWVAVVGGTLLIFYILHLLRGRR